VGDVEPTAPPPPPPTKAELDALLAPLSADDRTLALEQFDIVSKRPEEADLASYGCLGSVVGLVMLVALPNVWIRELPPAIRTSVMAVGIALVVGGLLVRSLAPSKRIRNAGARAQRAIHSLVQLDYVTDRAAWHRQASLALIDAFYSGGPWVVHTFDFEEARGRLGPTLPRVIAVETLLRLERRIYPVFTTFTSPAPESDRTAGS
jgi:hypothetical protein